MLDLSTLLFRYQKEVLPFYSFLSHEELNQEKERVEYFTKFFKTHGKRSFLRLESPGHFTGSAWLLNQDFTSVLMNYHKSLNKWVCFGGHADGDRDLFHVAKKETLEESGLSHFYPLPMAPFSSQDLFLPFDLEVFEIPTSPKAKEHVHLDATFMLVHEDPSERPKLSHESCDLKWVSLEELTHYNQEVALKMQQKKLQFIQKKVRETQKL